MSGEKRLIESLKSKLRLPSAAKNRIVSRGKRMLPAQYEAIRSLRQNIRLPEIKPDHIVQKGRDLIDSGSYYEALFYDRISRYSIPSLSQMYANSKFKTAVYRADEPAPCLDEILYKYESLIPFGKEYWFAIFTSLDGKKPMQLVATFGRRNTRRSVIDGIEVSGLNPVGGVLSTGAFVWCFDGKKKIFVPPVQAETVAGGHSIACSGNGLEIRIAGTAPEYRVEIKSDLISGDFKLSKPESGITEEVLNELKMGLNYQVYNLYYNFAGKLNGKEYRGRCYLQKVILSTPLVPWYWCRVVFQDGSSLVFFKPYFGSKEYNYPLRNKGAFFSAKHDRLFWFQNIAVESDRKNVYWQFRSNGGDYALDVSIKAYASHLFSFRSGGFFNYHEYMVKVKKFRFSADCGKIILTHKELGPGAGLFEDATGILI